MYIFEYHNHMKAGAKGCTLLSYVQVAVHTYCTYLTAVVTREQAAQFFHGLLSFLLSNMSGKQTQNTEGHALQGHFA